MDFSTFLERITVLVTILGGLGTAIVTFLSARNQTKESDASTDRAKIFTPIDAAERISSISLNLSQNLQDQLTECVNRREELIRILHETAEEENLAKVKLRKLVSKLRAIREKHDALCADCMETCPGFEVLNEMIDKIVTELETELEVS